MKITILGCGASSGIPVIGCECAVCMSSDPKNQRLRASLLVEAAGQSILIDAGPDLRQQALTHRIRHLDALVITHDHADHVHGIDDMRAFHYREKKAVGLYTTEETMESLRHRFHYCFRNPSNQSWFQPFVEPHLVAYGTPFQLASLTVLPFAQQHGKILSMGLRIGDFAYSTDVKHLPEEAFAALEGVETWIVDCLRPAPNPTHSHLEQTLEWIQRVKPKRAILTHLSHDYDYATLAAQLPPGVEPAYDGMIVECR